MEKEKPLEKMTAKELREVALEIPEIEGVHAMKKEELLEAIEFAHNNGLNRLDKAYQAVAIVV